jgi:transposase-like protein
MLRFPLDGLLDEQACYDFLLRILHPNGLHCPRGHPLGADQAPHRRRRPVIRDYRCRQCGAVFNLFTSTSFWKTCYRCSTIVQILRGIAQGTPTAQLADELGSNRTDLLERRHEIHTLLAAHFSPYRATLRPSNRSRRTVPERWRERPPTP